MLTRPTAPYTATNLREDATSNGVAFTADLNVEDRRIGTVENSGRGGPNRYHFYDPADRETFMAVAADRYPGEPDPEDEFALDLTTAYEFNRKPAVVFYTNEDNLGMGHVRVFGNGVTYDDAAQILADPNGPYAGKAPYIWNKQKSCFIPLGS